jgi:hypothetical protein
MDREEQSAIFVGELRPCGRTLALRETAVTVVNIAAAVIRNTPIHTHRRVVK